MQKKANYSLKSDFEAEEDRRIKRENECPHIYWATKCGVCGKIMASDHHINVHTQKSFKKDPAVAIYQFEGESLTVLHISRFRDLRTRFDLLLVLVDTIEQYQILSENKLVTHVSYESLFEEYRRQQQYNEEGSSTLILYPDTKKKETIKHLNEMQSFYKNLRVEIYME